MVLSYNGGKGTSWIYSEHVKMFSEKYVRFNPPCMVFSNRHCMYMFTSPMWPCQHTNRWVLTCILDLTDLMSWKLVNQREGLISWIVWLRPLQINSLYFRFSPHQLNGVFPFRLLPVVYLFSIVWHSFMLKYKHCKNFMVKVTSQSVYSSFRVH